GLMMEQYHGMTLGEARDLNVRDVAAEVEDLFYRQPFRIPAQFAFAGRAIGTLSGLATGLAPEFNLVSVAVPYAQKFLGLNRDGASQTAQQLLKEMLDAGRTLLTLPVALERVLTRIETGQLEVHIAENGVSATPRRGPGRQRRGVARRLVGGGAALAVCLAALGAGVVLTLNQLLVPGWFCLGLAALAAASLL